jgi:hypothetical protein
MAPGIPRNQRKRSEKFASGITKRGLVTKEKEAVRINPNILDVYNIFSSHIASIEIRATFSQSDDGVVSCCNTSAKCGCWCCKCYKK